MRTSPIHYIAPSSIEITPNANNSYNDLAVYIAPQTKIRVYCPRLGLGAGDGTYSEWDLTGRNRRLADSTDGYTHTKVYTIYARLNKQKSNDGYLVFTPKQQYDNKWYDKYSYITKDGLSIRYNAGADSEPRIFDDANYWYVKLGEVSAADSTNQRTVNLDTGILGTDQWNSEWALNPDALPLRIDMEYRLRNVADEEWDEWTAITRYVRWNQVLHVKAQLIEGWTGTDINRFHHWEITRDTGNADADGTWNEAHDSRDGDSGDYTETEFDLNLVHLRGTGDDFNSVLQALFTLTAYELNPDYTAGSEEPQYLPLISSSFSVIAETVETFDLEESSSTVTYNPQTGVYVPAIAYNEETHQYSVNSGVTIRLRAKDADGNTFYPTDEQISAIGLYVYYLPIGDDTSNVRRLTLTNGRGTLPSAPFLAGKSVEVWLQVGAYSSSSENVILSQKTITYIRFGAKGDTPVNCYRWYKEGLTPVKPTATNSDEPAPASGDATGASNVYPTDKWSSTVPNRPSTGEWLLWVCSSIRHGDNTRDAWSGPVQMSGTKGDAGEDATDREYIYKRLTTYPFTDTQYHPFPAKISTGEVSPGGIASGNETNKQLDDWVPNGWSDTAMPAQSDGKYVYMSARIKEPGQQWGAFSAPVLWSNWGVQGTDGDGVQYVYKLFDHELTDAERTSNIPTKPASQNANGEWIDNTMTAAGWSDDVLAPTEALPFCYCSIIKRINGTWGNYEKLGMWSKWAKDGESITKQRETPYYIKNTTGVRPAEDDPAWSTTKPTLNKGEWLFTKIDIEWSDGSHTILYTDERNPNDGQAGQDIIVDGATVMKYYVGDSNTTHPADGSSDWKDLSQVTQEQGKWLWSQATTYYRKADSTAGSHDAGTSINYNVSYIAEDGRTGRGIQSITEYYQATNSSAARQAPSSETGWDTDPNLSHLTDKWGQSHKYLWNMEKTVYSNVDGTTTTEYSVPQILAIWTKDGDAGRGIDSIQNYYKVTDTATAPSKGPEGWSTTPIAPGQGEYLWNYEIIKWVNGTPPSTETDVQQIGYAGIDGEDGTSVIAQYSVDGTSNWHSTFAAGDKYMRTSADGGTTWGSAIKIVGEDGSDGQNGDYIDSSFGISSKLVGDNQDGSPSDISTWSDAPIATTTQKPYLWCKQVSHTFSGSTETVGTPKYFRMTGADAVVYKIEFTDNTFALDPNTNKSVISIKGVVYRTEGSNTPTQVSLTGQDLAMRYIKNDGTTQELSLGGDFGIQNNEFVCTAGNGSFNTNFKTFIVEYKPDRQNILARGIIALTVYGEKGMEAIRGYADYLYSEDDTGSKPGPGIDELGKIDLLRYSGNQNRIEICELVSGSYVWKGYGKTDYPDGTMFVCKIDNHIYRASASGWVDEGRFKGDNAVVYKIDFTDSTFAYDPNTARNVVDIKGIVYKIDGGNTSVFTRLATDATLKLYFLLDDGTASQVPSNLVTISNGAFSTTNRTGAASTGEKNILAVLEINNNEVARANIPITVYATNGSRGKRGRSYYYAQPWEEDPTVYYLVNDSVAPYFEYSGEYYVYNPVDDIDGPVAMSAMGVPGSNDDWERMTNEFKYIITEAIFGKYADFGSFRITGNWLYSELGEFLGENTEEHPNFLHKLYDFRKSYPDDVTEVNLPACNYIHPEDPNITYVEIYDDSEESGSTIPTVTTKTNILTDDDDAWQNLKSGVIYSFSAYFANCKFYLRKNRVKRASIVLYKRSSTTISAHGITTTLYYKFSDGKLYTKNGNVYTEATDADLNNWKLEKPADNGNPCYVIQAAALGAGDYDQIQTTAWSEANILHTGDKVDVRYVRLYKRSSSAVTTVGINTALYYKFSTGKLYTDAAGTIEATSSDLNGWSLKAPTGSTDQLYLTAAIANRYTGSDKITSSEWVTPTPLTVDDLTLMYSSSSPTTQLVYFELAEDGEYQFIVEKYVQSQSGSAYLNWVIIREHYFLAYIAINGRNGYILQRNSHGHYNGTGNFTYAKINKSTIDKMHSGASYEEREPWIDIENGRLDISRYSQVRVVQYNNNPSSSGVQVLGYLYVDSSGTIKVSSVPQDFYNPNKGNIPAT